MWGRGRASSLVDTEEMAAFFEQLDHLNEAQLLSMRAAWRSTSRRAHEQAWTAVRAVGVREGLGKEIDRVRNRALAWTTRGSGTVPFHRLNDELGWQQVKMEAGEAIVDAALAVALGSRLDSGSRGILIGPWLRATEAMR
jgi:hypothetical protein